MGIMDTVIAKIKKNKKESKIKNKRHRKIKQNKKSRFNIILINNISANEYILFFNFWFLIKKPFSDRVDNNSSEY